MRVLKIAFLILAFVSQITVYASYAPDVVREDVKPVVEHSIKAQNRLGGVQIPKNEYSMLIDKYSQIWAVSPVLMSRMIWCESQNNRYALNDNPGVEFSVGLSQINILVHPITREQAEDPDFAINFMAEHIAKGQAPSMWYTCYKKATE